MIFSRFDGMRTYTVVYLCELLFTLRGIARAAAGARPARPPPAANQIIHDEHYLSTELRRATASTARV